MWPHWACVVFLLIVEEGRAGRASSHFGKCRASGVFGVGRCQDIDALLVSLVESLQDSFVREACAGLEAMVEELVGDVLGKEVGQGFPFLKMQSRM